MTVQPADERQHGWTPSHPNATVVILNAEPWSETVAEGTRFRLLAAEGNLPLTLSEVSQIPYGCDGTPTTMAAFRTPHDLAEQLVWILPEGNQSAAAVPVVAGQSSARQRAWSAGPLTITVKKTGAHTGTLQVQSASGPTLARDFDDTATMSEAPADLDLTSESALAVPIPAAAFRLDPDSFLLVLRSLSNEGLHLEVLALRGDTLDSAGTDYVYLCAY